MDFSTYTDPSPDDGNKDRIVNEDNDKAQEPEMHRETPIHDKGNKIKENNMIAKDKEGAPEELKEPTRDIIQNKKQGKKPKEDKKNEKTQKPKEKLKTSEKKSSSTKKSGEDNLWIAYPCSVCKTGVGNNSCLCNECKKWCHLKCSRLSSLDEYNSKYKCPRCMENKRGPGRPRLMTLTLEQESANAVRKFSKARRRPRDNDSPCKSEIKPQKNKDPDSSPHSKKPKAGEEGVVDDEDVDEDTDEDEEGEAGGVDNNKKDDDAENEDKDEEAGDNNKEMDEAEIMWIGKKIGNKNKNSKHQSNVNNKVLVYDGGHLTEEDVISLNDKNYVTDSILLFFINMLRRVNMRNMDKNKIKIVDPSVAHLIKNSRCLNTIDDQKNKEKLNEYDWVMYPVNNDAPEGNGGTHWSLLVYRKRDNKFLHFDPIKGLNKNTRSQTNAKNTR